MEVTHQSNTEPELVSLVALSMISIIPAIVIVNETQKLRPRHGARRAKSQHADSLAELLRRLIHTFQPGSVITHIPTRLSAASRVRVRHVIVHYRTETDSRTWTDCDVGNGRLNG